MIVSAFFALSPKKETKQNKGSKFKMKILKNNLLLTYTENIKSKASIDWFIHELVG